MAKKSMIERLALPMFIAGVLAMIGSATLSLGASANASSPVEMKKVTLTYLSSGYSANDGECGSAQDLYSTNRNLPSFRARNMSSSNSDKTIECTATFYVVTNVSIPSPKPVPTVTVIYRPEPGSNPRPSISPTRYPTPIPTATKAPNPKPSASQSPAPWQNWGQRPTPTPTKLPRP